ncbi:hypothetical protein AALP_AA8G167600 [Arabis alpina]|uniref:Uncharacterized protein n=1 Tax=Arabis alpina TaxID=50452 RepID=A0A087G7H9_ARAAL|nr:hypothetical protein AALP_AA8G167600 [Arabis alpina]
MGLFWSVALVSSYFHLLKARIFGSKSTPVSTSSSPMIGSSRPICIITGATSGLGKATAFALAEKGFYVVLVGRSSQLLSETLKEIKSKNKDAQLKAFEADMSSFQSIFKFKNSLEQWLSDSELHPSIQILVNNAGIMATSSRPTIEGYDRMIATNYIGPFSLTKLLLPLLKNSSVPSRVVNVTSFTHHYAALRKFDKYSVTGVYFSTLNQYPCAQVYEYSKLCLLLFSYKLHRQLRLTDDSHHVSVIAADPGFAKTNIMRELPSYIASVVFLGFKVLGLLQSPDEGAESLVDAALAPPEISGAYYFGGKGRTIESSQLLRARICGSKFTPSACCIHSQSQISSSKPICVITGATSGLGKATAFALASKGFHVVIVGRSSESLSKTLKEMKSKNKDAQVKAFQVDMSSFQSIFKFKNSLEQWLSDSELHPSIQLLVNNAGIKTKLSELTIEGYDRMIATNYIGAFSLTKLLLPLLKNSSVPSRVVNVSSFTHLYAPLRKFDKDSVTGVYFSRLNPYPYAQAYEYSKLCLLLFSYELHRQLRLADDSQHVSVMLADPGITKTNIMHEYPSYVSTIAFLGFQILGLLQSPDEGAEAFVDAALAPPDISGAYYFGGKGRTIESSQVSKDPKLAKQLWETSCDLFNELHLTSSQISN